MSFRCGRVTMSGQLGCVEVGGSSGWKTGKKPTIFFGFGPGCPTAVFQPLLPRTLMLPNEISIVRSHTLARQPRKISAKSAHRWPSNRPCRRATRAKNGGNLPWAQERVKFNSKCTGLLLINLTSNRWVLYLKKNLVQFWISTPKDFMICPPSSKKRWGSKITRTFGHPVGQS